MFADLDFGSSKGLYVKYNQILYMVFRLIGWIIGIGLAAILLIGFVIICPLVTLYAINTLFVGYISLEYNWVNWLCVAWFHMCIAASAGSKS